MGSNPATPTVENQVRGAFQYREASLTRCVPLLPEERAKLLCEGLRHPPLNDDDRPRHRSLGYADPLQGDLWKQCATAEPHVPPAHWQLLAQIDSEPDALLGDNGPIYIFIPSDVPRTGDFAKARGAWRMY